MVYSPKAKEEYSRQNSRGEEIGFGVSELLDSPEVWNLFYLSEPLATITESWPQSNIEAMPIFSAMVWPCVLVCQNHPEIVQDLLNLPAADFVDALKARDYKSLAPYKLLGESWITLMETRAKNPRGIVKSLGNVTTVNFLGHDLNLPIELGSCRIMPMSYLRH